MREDLAGVRVFEVVDPATSRDKRCPTQEGRSLASGDVTYVEVDFTHENLLERLFEHGHSDSARTLFVLSGVCDVFAGGVGAGVVLSGGRALLAPDVDSV